MFFCWIYPKNYVRTASGLGRPRQRKVRPAATAFDLHPRTKSLDAVATRVITGTSHWTLLLFLHCWLASAGGLVCGRAVVLPPKKDIKEFSSIAELLEALPPPGMFGATSILSAMQVLIFSLFLLVIVCICLCLTRFLCYYVCVSRWLCV